MKNLLVNEKILRKRMVDLDIKSINELSAKSGVSKPTIYDYLNGKTPLSAAFIKLCDFLELSPNEILTIESDADTEDNHV